MNARTVQVEVEVQDVTAIAAAAKVVGLAINAGAAGKAFFIRQTQGNVIPSVFHQARRPSNNKPQGGSVNSPNASCANEALGSASNLPKQVAWPAVSVAQCAHAPSNRW
jgi:hypothetical protein